LAGTSFGTSALTSTFGGAGASILSRTLTSTMITSALFVCKFPNCLTNWSALLTVSAHNPSKATDDFNSPKALNSLATSVLVLYLSDPHEKPSAASFNPLATLSSAPNKL